MSILQEIEQRAVDYMTETMRPPRFILLDKKSRKALDESFKVRARYMFPGTAVKSTKTSKIRKMATSAGWMDILEINTTKKFIEVVG